ncbi:MULTISPECIES: hypothetical protein [unclassified Rhizobium]|uniref:hypothetical protein n=1 Tax=unclassified Rhizobium TaxID=2613769 RepID=UPI00160F8FA5|nr:MULTISPECIES: hypothetical protein [unclassified Rhizobium]MBB3288967.1 hypothetical protein [Rhizobium sp. BK252]MBB3403709.1 hypothetical protein [Rhizobium sp. BK289]MBB3416105.1 hypothetical protein [Rhizobium sp. BK284]MDK4720165.1 hypothetical protein [Rhizobium sp. CNPSo 3968]
MAFLQTGRRKYREAQLGVAAIVTSGKAKAVQSREKTGPPFAGLEVNQIQRPNYKFYLLIVNGNEMWRASVTWAKAKALFHGSSCWGGILEDSIAYGS